MPPWNRLSYNDQHEILTNEEEFRRFVCDRLDTGLENDSSARNLGLWLMIIQTALLGALVLKVWKIV
jgi:hypothetical protein